MRAWRLPDAFGIDRLALEELPDAALGPGEVRVRVRAVSLNYRDVAMVEHGLAPRGVRLPFHPCSDAAGEVVEVGPGVSRVGLGNRVASTVFQGWLDGDAMPPTARVADGALADRLVRHEDDLVHVPEYLSDEQAATLPCAAVTAWHALVAKGRVRPGETVLVMGTGGVSTFALQFALMAGARVLVTSKSEEKLERVRALGAWEGVNYVTTTDWAGRVVELSGAGVDHVVEMGGLGTMEQSFRATRPGGRVSLIGVLTGFDTKVDPHAAMLKGLMIQAIVVGSRTMFEEMNRALEVNGVRPVIDRVFPFGQAPEAFRHLQAAGHVGKVVIAI